MNYKKKIAVVLPLLLIIVAAIYVNKFFTPLGTFLEFFSLAFAVVFFILLFTDVYVFSYWKKFTLIFFPLATLFVILMPSISEGFVGIDKELATIFLAALFFVISLGIIIWKSFRLKKTI
jgi:hypothetical protein